MELKRVFKLEQNYRSTRFNRTFMELKRLSKALRVF